MSLGYGFYLLLRLGGTDRQHGPQVAATSLGAITVAFAALAGVAVLRRDKRVSVWKRFAFLIAICVALAFLTFVIISGGGILRG